MLSSVSFNDYVWRRHLELQKPFIDHQKVNVLIVGDSMAGDFTNIIMESKLNSENLEVRTIPIRHGCLSLINLNNYSKFKTKAQVELCIKQHKSFGDNTALEYADLIILASNWPEWSVAHLDKTISTLRNITNAEIVIVGKKQMNKNGLKSYVMKIKYIKVSPETVQINTKISEINEKIIQINPTDYFCVDNICPVASKKEYVYIYDSVHLTPKGAMEIGNSLYESRVLNQFLSQ